MNNRFIFCTLICVLAVNVTECASNDTTLVAHKQIDTHNIQCMVDFIKTTLAQDRTTQPNMTLYSTLFDAFCQMPSYAHDVGMQTLIQHLLNKAQPSSVWTACTNVLSSRFGLCHNRYTLLATSVLGQYFNLHIRPNQALTTQEALVAAHKHHTISCQRLHEILQTAVHTNFISHIDPTIVANIQTNMMQDPHTPTDIRAQLLNDTLIEHISSGKPLYDVVQHVKELKDNPFKTYAQTLLIALNPKKSINEHCSARSCIANLAQQHPEAFSENPDAIAFCYGKLFKAFHKKTMLNDRWYVHVSRGFKDPLFPDGKLCFGYVDREVVHGPNDCHLYACDKKTGLPVWIYSQQSQRPYTVSNNRIYCITDTGSIAVLNADDGARLDKLSFNYKLHDALSLETHKDTLFVLAKKYIKIVDVKTRKCVDVPVPMHADLSYASFIDGTIIIPMQKQFFTVDSTGIPQLINHNSFNRLPYMQSNNTSVGQTHCTIIGSDRDTTYLKS